MSGPAAEMVERWGGCHTAKLRSGWVRSPRRLGPLHRDLLAAVFDDLQRRVDHLVVIHPIGQ